MQPHNLSPPPANLSPPNTFLRTSHLQGGSWLNFRAFFSIALPWGEIIYCCAECTGDAECCCAGRLVLQPGCAGRFMASGGGSERGLQCLGTCMGKREICPELLPAFPLLLAQGCLLRNTSSFCTVTTLSPKGTGVGCWALRSASMGWQHHLWLFSFSIAAILTLSSLEIKGCFLPLGNAVQHCCKSPKHGSSIASNCNIWDYCYKVLKDLLLKKEKQAENPKESFSSKTSTISQTGWYCAFCHKCITTQRLNKSYPQTYQMPLV